LVNEIVTGYLFKICQDHSIEAFLAALGLCMTPNVRLLAAVAALAVHLLICILKLNKLFFSLIAIHQPLLWQATVSGISFLYRFGCCCVPQ
jgi:hypothetical protein